MKWYSQNLGTVRVSKTWWVRNDSLGHERPVGIWIGLNAGLPATLEHLKNHPALTANITRANGCKLWDDAWIFDHILVAVRNQFQPRMITWVSSHLQPSTQRDLHR
jgi:hypothetical protein